MLSYYCPTVPMNVLARVVKHNETWHVICPLNGQRVCDWVWMVWDGCPCRGSQSLCPFPRRMFDVFRFRVPQSNRDCLNTELSWPEATCSWCFWWHMRRLEAFVALFVWHNLNNWKFYAYAHNAMHRTATAEWPDADGWGMHMHMHIHIHIHHPASTSSILRPFGSCLVALMSKLQASHHCLILWPATWEWN